MPLQSSGPISLNDIAGEFGGSTPHSLSEYYGAASGIPGSGTISIGQFYGKANTVNVQYLAVACAHAPPPPPPTARYCTLTVLALPQN